MDYAVKRLSPGGGATPTYHLLDPQGAVMMAAEQSATRAPSGRRQVKLTRPDGRLLATIDLPETGALSAESVADYAIVLDYAVYAILSIHRRPANEESAGSRENDHYLTIEVEGDTWLVLHHPELPNCFAIYDDIPAGLHTYDTITELDLPPSIGRICHTEDDVTYTANLEPYRLHHTGVVVLSLAYLLDRVIGR